MSQETDLLNSFRTILLGEDDDMLYVAKMMTDSNGTAIANDEAYDTVLEFTSTTYDNVGSVADLVNHRFNIPPASSGFTFCRINYSIAWQQQAADGYRAARILNSEGHNYGNQRLLSVGTGATTNTQVITPWIMLNTTNVLANQLAYGDWVALYPAHDSTTTPINAGVDYASSFFMIEFK